MGWVMMSERELNRVEILAQVDDGRLSVDSAANMLDLTRRQIFRLLKRYRQDGAAAIRHKSRGRTPNNQIHRAKRDYALSLIKEQYPDFGPTLAVEMLAEHHGFKVSRETLRKCPLGRLLCNRLPGNRCRKMASGCRASSAAGFTSHVCVGNVSAS